MRDLEETRHFLAKSKATIFIRSERLTISLAKVSFQKGNVNADDVSVFERALQSFQHDHKRGSK